MGVFCVTVVLEDDSKDDLLAAVALALLLPARFTLGIFDDYKMIELLIVFIVGF